MKTYEIKSKCFKHFLPLLIICAIFSLSALPSSYAAQAGSTQDIQDYSQKGFEYTIGLGDVIEVQVWKEPDLSRTPVPVRIDGRISLPLLGDVDAVGKSIGELTHTLEKKYGNVINDPAVSIMLLENKSWRYYVVGQIVHPGEFSLDYPITLLQALARSGGFLEWAKKSDIRVIRRKSGREELLMFDYEAIVRGKNLDQNILIKPGDTIVIP